MQNLLEKKFSLLILDKRDLRDLVPKNADQKQINKICREQLNVEIYKFLAKYYSQLFSEFLSDYELSLYDARYLFELDKTENGKPFIKLRENNNTSQTKGTSNITEISRIKVTPKVESLKSILQNLILKFNITHSKDLYVCAFSHHNIGVDVEYIKKKRDFIKIADYYFFGEETEYFLIPQTRLEERLERVAEEISNGKQRITFEQVRRFYNLWTVKEAAIKSFGGTIANDLCNIEVDFTDFTRPIVKYIPIDSDIPDDRTFVANTLHIDDDYVCSIVTETSGFDISHPSIRI